jgi:RNA polymerase sigma-70 factor, ECF subfamily
MIAFAVSMVAVGPASLARAFRRARGDAPPPDDPTDARLEAALDAAVAAVRAAFAGLPVDPASLATHLARAVPAASPDPVGALAGLRLGELGLACACLLGDPVALETLDGLLAAEARRAAGELRQPAWVADEVQQILRHRLLVADGAEPARLATYAGQGPLGRWLGVAATRAALNLVRDGRRSAALDDARLAGVAAPGDDPALELLRRRHRADFEAAVREAFASLSSARDRNLLRLYYLDQVGLDRLGGLYKVHPSTISRWIAAVREQLFDETRRRLGVRLGLSDGELDSLLRVIRTDLDLTLSRILRASD